MNKLTSINPKKIPKNSLLTKALFGFKIIKEKKMKETEMLFKINTKGEWICLKCGVAFKDVDSIQAHHNAHSREEKENEM